MDRRKSLAKGFAVHEKKDDAKQDSDVFLSELISHRLPEPKVQDAMNMMGNPLQKAQTMATSQRDQMQETADKLK